MAATSARLTVRPTARSRRNVASASTSGSSGMRQPYVRAYARAPMPPTNPARRAPGGAPGAAARGLPGSAREVEAGRAVTAIAVRVLRQVLLVVTLGVVELA